MKKEAFSIPCALCSRWRSMQLPLRFILINVLGISQSVVRGANTLLLSNFVNELIASVGKGRFEAALIAATAFYVCGIIGYQLLNTLFNYALTEFLEICDETYRYEFNEKISKLFPLAFEQSESLDEIQKAQAGRDDANVFMFHMIGIIDMVPAVSGIFCDLCGIPEPGAAIVYRDFVCAVHRDTVHAAEYFLQL